MPNFRFLIATFLVTAVIAAGCSPLGSSTNETRPIVLTTFTVLQDMAQNVAGDHLVVESITKPGTEIHGYEPTPQDIRSASRAVLILDNGLGLEAWFSRFVADLDVEHAVVSTGVDVIAIPGGTTSGTPNPHAWMSPVNAEIYLGNITTAFAALDPEHAADFAANARAYRDRIRQVYTDTLDALRTIPDAHRALVTCEGAFSYLARDAGLTEKYLWEVNAEQQVTARRLADTIAFVRAHEIPAVFCESTVSDRTMQQVVEATGTTFGGVLHVDSLSGPDGPVPTYLDLLRHDTETIVAGLGGNAS